MTRGLVEYPAVRGDAESGSWAPGAARVHAVFVWGLGCVGLLSQMQPASFLGLPLLCQMREPERQVMHYTKFGFFLFPKALGLHRRVFDCDICSGSARDQWYCNSVQIPPLSLQNRQK